MAERGIAAAPAQVRPVVFECAGCGAGLSVPVVAAQSGLEAADPGGAAGAAAGAAGAVTVAAAVAVLGRYAVDPEPFGPPYLLALSDASHLIGRISGGPRGTFVLSPADVPGAVPVHETLAAGPAGGAAGRGAEPEVCVLRAESRDGGSESAGSGGVGLRGSGAPAGAGAVGSGRGAGAGADGAAA